MPEEILSNIEQLKKRFFGEDSASFAEIEAWESQVKRAMRTSKAKSNPAVQMILEEAHKRIQSANFLLMNDRNLTEDERKAVFERRDAYEWFLNLFDEAEKTLHTVKKAVDDELA